MHYKIDAVLSSFMYVYTVYTHMIFRKLKPYIFIGNIKLVETIFLLK